MTDSTLAQAEALEELLPDVVRALFPPSGDDPFSDLPLGQLRVLRLLWKSPRTPSELAKTLEISASAIAQVLSRLEAADLVLAESNEHDRRSKTVELSEHGRCLMRQRREARARRAAETLRNIDEADRSALIAALERLVSSCRQTDVDED